MQLHWGLRALVSLVVLLLATLALRRGYLRRGAARRAALAALAVGACASLLGAAWLAKRRGYLSRPPKMIEVRLEGEGVVLPRPTVGAGRKRGPLVAREMSLEVRGARRDFLALLPAERSPSPLPLVFVVHGDGDTGPGFHDEFAFEQASGGSAILVYPTGLGKTWEVELHKNDRELAFFRAIVDRVEASAGVDRSRVFGAGYSNGGFLLHFMACHAPGFLRAIATHAAGAPYGLPGRFPNGLPRCPGQRGVPVLAMHGEGDYTVTLASGRFSAAYWAHVNGCDTGTWETTGYPECRSYKACPAGLEVAFCQIPRLGHWIWDHGAEANCTFFRLHGAAP